MLHAIRRQAGFTVVELAVAGTAALLVMSSGFMLYKSQTKMSIRQSDVNAAQLTVDYVINSVRTQVVSAGGGLPQMANGLRKAVNGKGIVTYVNPLNLSAQVVDSLNTDSTDGVIPINDPSPLVGTGYLFITRDENYALAQVDTIDVGGKFVRIKNHSMEDALGGVDFVYPVEYCSLYVDSAKNLIKTFVGKTSGFANIPLATQIDSLDISYDLSGDGNGSFGQSLTDSSKVSRVKITLRVKGAHGNAGATARTYENIIGVRRGRLYNRGV